MMNLIWLVIAASLTVVVSESQARPYLINCGSNSTINFDGRVWVGDSVPDDNFTLSSPGITLSAAAINRQHLYKTVRIFNTTSHYKFSNLSGSCCIRLHFCPFDGYDVNDTAFDVVANNLKLLSRFNVSAEIWAKNLRSGLNGTYLVKEYFLYVSSDELLIEFVPSFGPFAFVNAIEVFQVPDNLFDDSVSRVGSSEKATLGLSDRGLETVYRFNVGGPEIEASKDVDMWRKWESDEVFMFSLNAANSISNNSNISYVSANDSFIAPLLVYESARIMTDNEVVEKRFNVSWRFFVDPNFDYLLRLHFCELLYDSANQRVFRIFINNKTAAENYDVFARAGGMNKAFHEDFVDATSQQVDTLWLQLGPDSLTSSSGADALLNGLEIFKISRNGNLAHVSEMIDAGKRGSTRKKKNREALWAGIGIGMVVITAVLVGGLVFLSISIRRKEETLGKNNPSSWRSLDLYEIIGSTTNAKNNPMSNVNGSVATYRLGKRFTLAEIRMATRDFDESLVLGTGGFGKVYKGVIEEGRTVAIKRANPQSQQGLAEFETEIEMLSKLRHRHLVSMIGYCDEKNEMILVYEYMANGTLRSHLYGSDLPALTWKQRVDVCIGAARGLHYLHTGADRSIIHRDVKTTNILLDDNFVAKMSDFGLSKTGPALDHTHVSTAVKGSFGYLDPEYFRRQQLTQKSDVYSFGVVLFEVICARPVINPTLPKDQINLAEWAIRWQRQRSLEAILDPRLVGDYSRESLNKFGEIAGKCLADEGRNRPTMGEVLWHLEYVLQLNETYVQAQDADLLTGSEVKFARMSLGLPLRDGEEACSPQTKADYRLQGIVGSVDFSHPQGR